jgi:hypothetical protein
VVDVDMSSRKEIRRIVNRDSGLLSASIEHQWCFPKRLLLLT